MYLLYKLSELILIYVDITLEAIYRLGTNLEEYTRLNHAQANMLLAPYLRVVFLYNLNYQD